MKNCKHWYADGTFSTSPSLFTQIYTIHGIQYSNVFPLVFPLLPNKMESTYCRLFEALKSIKTGLSSETIMVDFEKAAMNAISKYFPGTKIRGCFFHFTQSVWRHVQQTGLQQQYIEDSEFALQIRMMTALSFVPLYDVEQAFNDLMDTNYYTTHEELLTPLTNYFEDTWIGRVDRRNRRKPALFPVSLWNCHAYLKENILRTNNSVEGWHNIFSSTLNVIHPNIWKCIEVFKNEETLNKIQIEQCLLGNSTVVKKKYKDFAARLKTVCYSYRYILI
ncbi:uncharacterized protein LOC112681362 [Sipha flava]|uniref:Uncharacterized protein LOC112681362 n=1 Tax=Sipha flava TaxID=143950 RepID=A0A8B8F989_9HEMI|nr:uncharacterized protein LOC112681362 [Sipha flava]